MRILLLTTYFRPDIASTGVIMSTLADEFVAKGHQVTVLTSTPHYDTDHVWPEYSGKLIYKEVAEGMRIIRISTHVAKDKSKIFQRLLAYATFNTLSLLVGLFLPKYDVILVPSPPLSNAVIAETLSCFRGARFVYNVQDIWPDVAIRAGVLKNPTLITLLTKLENFVYRKAAGLTVISDGFKRNLLAKGVPEKKISVISNFIDTDFIRPQVKDNAFSSQHQLGSQFTVLFAGNMGFSQGLETVLDAARILEKIPKIQFLMVGNGAGRNQAEEYLKQLGLKNVRFLPYQPHEDLPDMYGAADLCLIPLRRGFTNDSVPCKLFTIMAAGRPAVAGVDAGSDTSHLLQAAKSGICVEPEEPAALADAILHYYQNPVEASEAGKRARHFVESEFSPSVLADKYLDAMHKAIAGHTQGGTPTAETASPLEKRTVANSAHAED